MCVNSPATATAFALCGLDADCPQGDFCDLGVCTHECVADRDCTGGMLCDARGQCRAPEALGEPAPAAVPTAASPVLVVDTQAVDLTLPGTPNTFSVRNSGGSPMKVRLLSDQRWLSASPAFTTLAPGAQATVTVQPVPGAPTFGETRATLRVLSGGGSAVVAVSVPARLDGTYSGHFQPQSPVALGTLPLALVLLEDEAGSVTGVVDAQHSPAVGFRAAVTGTREADGRYLLAFRVPAAAGSTANPDLGQPVLREVTLEVRPSGYQALEGTLTETLSGPLAVPVRMTGPVRLKRGGARRALSPETATVTLAEPSAPTWGEPCTTCPSGAPCPSGSAAADLEAGKLFLQGAMPLYAGYRAKGYAQVKECLTASGQCFNAAHMACAQKRFFAALSSGEGASASCTGLDATASTVAQCATRGLLDTLKGQVQWRELLGNEYRVQGAAWALDFATAKTNVDAARPTYLYGLVKDPRSASSLRPMSHPYFLRWVEGLTQDYLRAPRLALLPERLSTDTQAAVYTQAGAAEDVRHALTLLTAYAQAADEAAALQHRSDYASGSTVASAAAAQRATASVYLAAALYGALLERAGAVSRLPTALPEALTRLSTRADSIASGFNPAGVSDEVVPYIFKPGASADDNNFLQVARYLEASPLPTAREDERIALEATRDFELSQASLSSELNAQRQQLDARLLSLCGSGSISTNLSQCAASTGDIYQAAKDVEAAQKRLEQAQLALDNLYREVDIEEARAAQVAGYYDQHAEFIKQNGVRECALSIRQRNLSAVASLVKVATSMGNPVSLVTALISQDKTRYELGGSLTSVVASFFGADLANHQAELAAQEKAEVQYVYRRVELANSEARVKSMMLQGGSLLIGAELAAMDWERARQRLGQLVKELSFVLEEQRRHDALTGLDPRADPSFRAFRDKEALRAADSFALAQRWAFYAARAYEYELNVSYAPRAQLFRLTSARDLGAFLTNLKSAYYDEVSRIGLPQRRTAPLSLRNDVFRLGEPVTDVATGKVYSPAERFRRLIADPKNRDSDGNLRLEFDLPIDGTMAYFSPGFCNDRLVDLRASLVGAQLGVAQALLELRQQGSGLMRSCTERDVGGNSVVRLYNLQNTLGERRAALQAGVNLSGANDPNANAVANGELGGRPIGGHWVLRINVRTEAENQKLNLAALDDIILYVTHDTNTLQ